MSTRTQLINAKADLCVKCGLCLPHCPTYRLFADENESPRGRIALIQALANEQLHADATLRRHLDHCLGCRRCERICPSGVDYGYLLDHSRQMLDEQQPRGGIRRWLIQNGLRLTHNKTGQRLLQTLLYYYQTTGLQGLLRRSGLLRLLRLARLDRVLPALEAYRPLHAAYPAEGRSPRGKVGLFTGCTGHLFDQSTLRAALHILQNLGYEVIVPEAQTCCGALHQHQGELKTAGRLAAENIRAFADADTIIYIASGCGAQLREYAGLDGAESFVQRVKEITTFLADEDLTQFHFQALPKRLTIHTPCSLRNNLRQEDASQQILSHIPGLQLTAVPAETGCCGAAGSYMLSQPHLADTLREATLGAIRSGEAELVSTTNIGCALHLHAGMGQEIEVTHPVTLLVRQMDK